jgi:uncharacterized UPF0146 family protein
VVDSPPSRRALVGALARYDRLVEVGVGRRPDVARALADRGAEVVAVDVAVAGAAREAADETGPDGPGTLRVVAGDVTALATADDAAVRAALGLGVGADSAGDGTASAEGADGVAGVDAVYARNLPAEIQRPTVALAERLDAACLFTTLGFEEPVVPVRQRSTADGTVVCVAR